MAGAGAGAGYERGGRTHTNYQDHRYGLRPPNSYNTDYQGRGGQSNKDDFFSSLKSMFGVGETQEQINNRRYDNPYSKLRERNKRETDTGWRGQITRAPYNNPFEFAGQSNDQVTSAPGVNGYSQAPANNRWNDRLNNKPQNQNQFDRYYPSKNKNIRRNENPYSKLRERPVVEDIPLVNEPPPKVLPVGQGCQITYLGNSMQLSLITF